MKTSVIRQKFLDFFVSKGHQQVASSSLIPGNDPTLMFTVAGMVQFKNVFLGLETRDYRRAVTSQKCLRAGGKHNDLENVGYTARHHTFFEMLGNFSFGDYFKQSAIPYAWEFLTSPAWLGLPAERLLVTLYENDDETYHIWRHTINLPDEKIIRIGDNKGAPYASDNFWSMGDTGPCGPCTEIFYDHGPDIPGTPPGSPDESGDRFMEIWNIVFMQFNRHANGQMEPLPKPSVDTGMGLERIATVVQHVKSNYETDGFACLVRAAARETGVVYNQSLPSLKAIADHIRACAFMISDGILPSNEGRGYVLRRIARRAIRHGYKLGQKAPFFYKLVADLVAEIGNAYPELRQQQSAIEETLYQEERRFAETLEHGMSFVETALAQGIVDGDILFKLYDTYGFPVDLTADICRERGVDVDLAGFERAMEAQRKRGRAHSQFKTSPNIQYKGIETHFHGYEVFSLEAKILAIYKGQHAVDVLNASEEGIIVLDHTPFYAEGGGQVGDTGKIFAQNAAGGVFNVSNTQKIQAAVYGHQGVLTRNSLRVGDKVTATLNLHHRLASARNHSATHLLHSALRRVLGKHVQQKGSLVDPKRTRFDFTHPEPITLKQLQDIESLVNQIISRNLEIKDTLMSIDEAHTMGAMALFGEKYGDIVRVLTMGDFSTELCGGTHVTRTGDIGLFKIVSESGIAAGIRRIEAVTAESAIAYIQAQDSLLKQTIAAVKANATSEIIGKIEALQAEAKMLEKELVMLKRQLAKSDSSLFAQAIDLGVGNVKTLATELPHADHATLRRALDQLKDKLGCAAIVLASQTKGKVTLVAGVTANLTDRIQAKDLVNMVARQVGGKGGGRPDMAQASGTQPEHLSMALASVYDWVRMRI